MAPGPRFPIAASFPIVVCRAREFGFLHFSAPGVRQGIGDQAREPVRKGRVARQEFSQAAREKRIRQIERRQLMPLRQKRASRASAWSGPSADRREHPWVRREIAAAVLQVQWSPWELLLPTGRPRPLAPLGLLPRRQKFLDVLRGRRLGFEVGKEGIDQAQRNGSRAKPIKPILPCARNGAGYRRRFRFFPRDRSGATPTPSAVRAKPLTLPGARRPLF